MDVKMNKKARAEKIRHFLTHLYPAPAIPLHHTSPYTFLIAVLLSAQCTDARVNLVTPHLFAEAATPQEMVLLEVKTIEALIKTCGLGPKKATAIKQLSQIILDKHKGEVPQSFEELEALPGVGHKTASVVMSQIFQVPAFPVDTHILRCAKRWKLSEGKNVVQVERDLKSLYAKKYWNPLHLQIIFFAREYCTARAHNPQLCPICSWI